MIERQISGIHSRSTSAASLAIILDVQPVVFRYVLRRSCAQCSRSPAFRKGAALKAAHPCGCLHSHRPMWTAGPGLATGVHSQSAPHFQRHPFASFRRKGRRHGNAGPGDIGHGIHRRSGLSTGLALPAAGRDVCHSLEQLRSIIAGRTDLNQEGFVGVSRLLQLPFGLMLGAWL